MVAADIRHVAWFSCGAASAVALYLLRREGVDITPVYCDTGGEHEDNVRFLRDVEAWLGLSIEIIKNEKYADHFDVFEKTRFIVGPHGARCTGELKKLPRHKYQRPDDVQMFGYTAEEEHRADRFNELYPEVETDFPLIRHGVTKSEALGLLWREGIKIPAMYELGYNNNNCIGCVKGGKGYWMKIRNDFPEHFQRMVDIEREVGATIFRTEAGGPLYLDEIGSGGRYPKPEAITCDFICQGL